MCFLKVKVTKMILRKTVIIASLLCTISIPAHSNPEGGIISGGSAAIIETDKKLDIHQQTDRAVIDWRSFDIQVDEHTQFHQPQSSSVALNRVNNANPSQIRGKLSANGNIVLVNPNGVFFDRDSIVDVNGIVASTADMDNDKFLSGGEIHLNKTGDPNGIIVNMGHISAREAGLVGLVAPVVENHGVIVARSGRVHLASGDTATVDFYGDGLMEIAVSDEAKVQATINTGIIQAAGGTIAITAAASNDIVNSLIIASGELHAPAVAQKNGKIIIFGEGSNAVKDNSSTDKGQKQGDSYVAVNAYINASGRNEGEAGGQIEILGDHIAIASGTFIDASGDTNGGDIKIGGNYLGTGTTAAAKTVAVAQNTLIANDALTRGDGGRTIIWSDDTTEFHGNIFARGGIESGNGGFVETSGKKNLQADGYVDLTARSETGEKGTYLLDPADITIYGNVDPRFVSTDGSLDLDTDLQLWLDANTIAQADGTDVTLWADQSGNGNDATIGAGNAPEYYSNQINGNASVQFTNVNNDYMSGNLGLGTINALTVFSVGNFSDMSPGPYDHQYIYNIGGGSNDLVSLSKISQTGSNQYYAFVEGGVRTGPVLDFNTHQFTQQFGTSGVNHRLWIEGVSQTVNNSSAISIADNYELGRWNAPTHYLEGNIGELVVYDQEISTDRMQLIEQYQSAKYDLALTPPGTGGSEVAQAMAADGYGIFAASYLERLSATADISLLATNTITLDLQGADLALNNDRSISLTTTTGNITSVSLGSITTNRTGLGGNITMTSGGAGNIDLSDLSLFANNGGQITLNSGGGNIVQYANYVNPNVTPTFTYNSIPPTVSQISQLEPFINETNEKDELTKYRQETNNTPPLYKGFPSFVQYLSLEPELKKELSRY